MHIVGIRFKDTGKICNFDPDGLELKSGDLVIIDSERGLNIGEVVREVYEVDTELLSGLQPLNKVVRKASDEDLRKAEGNKELKKETSEFCRTRIKEMGLPMKLIGTDLSFDGSKAIFYFTSEGRVDFRELVKDLAAKFRIRIEMKQIGVRDEARLVGGYGCCGRTLCCETFIKDFEPVSIRMAKKQELALNPAKISGVCGRLMCCLVFEYEIYDEIKKDTDELKNVGKPPCPEVDQTYGSTSEEGDSAGFSILSDKTGDLISTPLTNATVEQGTMNSVEPKTPFSRRKRRRRRRRRSEGRNNLER
jgi:cell fate regulator YaaT (PSP1 superfamily)